MEKQIEKIYNRPARPGMVGDGFRVFNYFPNEELTQGGPFEMIQLWVNLPAKNKLAIPKYQAITADQMGKVMLADDSGLVNVIAGSFNEHKGPATTFTPVNMFDIRLNKGGHLTTSIPLAHHTILLVVNGEIEVNNEKAGQHDLVLFKNKGEEINVNADKDSVVLLLSGEPINEPIAQYGPFVMNTHRELQEAFQEFQSGKFGVLE